jgi:LuxR family maltose regulon positive regulatory protein
MIDRPALRAALDRSLATRLTLVVAQAGAGKTTLLRQWSASHPELRRVVLDIDPSDNDPGHFVRRLVGALAPHHRYVVDVAEPLVSSGGRLTSPVADALGTVARASHHTVIVLDNLHRITNLHLLKELGSLVQQSPPHVHWVLSTRVDPPLSLTSYRLDDDLVELRRDDLAFDLTESTTLLERLTGAPVGRHLVQLLWHRTEGWAAGLQLAGLSLRLSNDPEAFVAEFGGSDRLVADYLSEEVLASLSGERRQLLLQMSALDDMCEPLVRATSMAAEAPSILHTLDSESMFLVPLDAHGEWFRFHHLFRELLRSRLRAESPAEELRIITTAADWNFSCGRVKSAMDYLLRAQARGGALEAMLAVPEEFATDDGHVPGAEPDASLSAPVVSGRLRAELLGGVRQILKESGATRSPHPAGPSGVEPERWRGRTSPGFGYVAAQVLWRARPEASPETTRRRLAEIEERCAGKHNGGLTRKDTADLAEALVAGGRSRFLAGNLPEARRWLTRARVTAGSEVVEAIAASSALSLVEAWSGNVDKANALVADTFATAQHAGLLSLPSIADASLASVLTALEDDVAVAPVTSAELALVAPGPMLAPRQDVSNAISALRTNTVAESRTEWALAETLTDRESEILAYLPTRFSNVDLANQFFVSVNTIKTHIAHIYRKLDVADRDSAIRRARELGIL